MFVFCLFLFAQIIAFIREDRDDSGSREYGELETNPEEAMPLMM